MKYIIGLFMSFLGFYFAADHLNQDFSEFWDVVAFSVVVIGTAAAMLITFPAAPVMLMVRRFAQKFFLPSRSVKKHAEFCFEAYSRRLQKIKSTSIEEKLISDGLELNRLGFDKETIEDIISQRFEIYSKRISMLANWFKRCAKYPPAFGLAGTVIGLIHLMRGLSAGADAKELGIRMAVALIATFYGILLSNLFLSPLGEWLSEELHKDEIKAEMSLRLVLMIKKNANPVEVQEVLNSFLSNSEKARFAYDLSMTEEVA